MTEKITISLPPHIQDTGRHWHGSNRQNKPNGHCEWHESIDGICKPGWYETDERMKTRIAEQMTCKSNCGECEHSFYSDIFDGEVKCEKTGEWFDLVSFPFDGKQDKECPHFKSVYDEDDPE